MNVVACARGVTHEYGRGPLAMRVLDDVSLRVHTDELTAIVGPSGSGKTTLVSILAGLLRPTTGDVELCGRPIQTLKDAQVTAVRRGAVGFVFQAFHLFPSLDATDNVAEPLAMAAGLPIAEARRAARALLSRCGLGDRLDALPEELSAGQRQRVAIARAVAPRPRLVIADEPTAALDRASADAVMSLLREQVDASCGVLLVTHDLRLVRAADHVVEISDGRVASDRSAERAGERP